jgi:hypothetical protein
VRSDERARSYGTDIDRQSALVRQSALADRQLTNLTNLTNPTN